MAGQLIHYDPHLAQCAAELVEWDATGVLVNRHVRDATSIFRALGVGSHLEIARRLGLVESRRLHSPPPMLPPRGVD